MKASGTMFPDHTFSGSCCCWRHAVIAPLTIFVSTLRKGSMSETISDTSGHILTSEMTDAEGRLEVPEGC